MNFYNYINELLKLAEDTDYIKFTAGKFLQQALYILQETGIYIDNAKEQKKKTTADKTWKKSRDFFNNEYHNLQEDQTMNSIQGGLYSTANAAIGIADVGDALKHLYMEAPDD